jgi:uncharacterized SAM-binding protein YcdF (DUF218 family)
MHRVVRIVIIVVSSASVFILAGTYAFTHSGNFLLKRDPLPDRLDVIVTFAEEGVRMQYSRELYDRYPASHWIVSYRDFSYIKQYLPRPFDSTRITMVDFCKHTRDEVNFVKKWLDANKGRFSCRRRPAIGFVSCPYHERRICWLAWKAGLTAGYSLFSLPAPLSWYGWPKDFYERWWKYGSARKLVLSEYEKMAAD